MCSMQDPQDITTLMFFWNGERCIIPLRVMYKITSLQNQPRPFFRPVGKTLIPTGNRVLPTGRKNVRGRFCTSVLLQQTRIGIMTPAQPFLKNINISNFSEGCHRILASTIPPNDFLRRLFSSGLYVAYNYELYVYRMY